MWKKYSHQPQSQGGRASDVLGFTLGLLRYKVRTISSSGAQSVAQGRAFAPHVCGPAPSSAVRQSSIKVDSSVNHVSRVE